MSTAFQPNAFQQDAFQILGGVLTTTFDATISVTQDDDSVSLTVQNPTSGAPRWRGRWHARIGDKTYIGTYEQVMAALQTAAEKAAEQAVELAKPPKPKVVKVRPMREAPTVEQAVDRVLEQSQKAHDYARDELKRIYENAYRDALMQLAIRRQQDEDDELALIL